MMFQWQNGYDLLNIFLKEENYHLNIDSAVLQWSSVAVSNTYKYFRDIRKEKYRMTEY